MIVFCLLFSPILASLEINYQIIFRFTFIAITYISLFLSERQRHSIYIVVHWRHVEDKRGK